MVRMRVRVRCYDMPVRAGVHVRVCAVQAPARVHVVNTRTHTRTRTDKRNGWNGAE
jgi:hypothetical protein